MTDADPSDWYERLSTLPRRAVAALAVRCAKRVEVFTRLGDLLAAAYAAGVDVPLPVARVDAIRRGQHAACMSARAARDTGFAEADLIYAAAAAAHDSARAHDSPAAAAAAEADFRTLAGLAPGPAGEPGPPVAWDDPRLGPLWPGGAPAWHAGLEAECREVEARLGGPPGFPLGAALEARLDTRERLDQRWAQGKLEEYAGGYIITDGDTIFARGRNLLVARDQAEAAARAAGVAVDRLVDYFVPAAD